MLGLPLPRVTSTSFFIIKPARGAALLIWADILFSADGKEENRFVGEEAPVAQLNVPQEEDSVEADSSDSSSNDDEDSDDFMDAPMKRIGILPMKGTPYYSLPDGTKVKLVDGSLAYPFSTSLSDNEFLFYIRKSLDSDRFVKAFFFSLFLWNVCRAYLLFLFAGCQAQQLLLHCCHREARFLVGRSKSVLRAEDIESGARYLQSIRDGESVCKSFFPLR